jgi:hypothetical protein
VIRFYDIWKFIKVVRIIPPLTNGSEHRDLWWEKNKTEFTFKLDSFSDEVNLRLNKIRDLSPYMDHSYSQKDRIKIFQLAEDLFIIRSNQNQFIYELQKFGLMKYAQNNGTMI